MYTFASVPNAALRAVSILDEAGMNAIPNLQELSQRLLVIVGMPGAGKSTLGKRLAAQLNLPFIDADAEIEAAAGMAVPEIFAQFGEPAFREGERRVIARLLKGKPCVLATGGGAFMDPQTRANIKAAGALSLWLNVALDNLASRTARATNRPLIQNQDPRASLLPLWEKRAPTYALADVSVVCDERPAEENAACALAALAAFIKGNTHV